MRPDREKLISLLLGFVGIPNAGVLDPYYQDAEKRVDEYLEAAGSAQGVDLAGKLNELAARMFEDGQTYWAGKVSDLAKAAPPSPAPAAPALRWTREKPTTEGWYWVRWYAGGPDVWTAPEPYRFKTWPSPSLGGAPMEWAGPLPEPSGTPSETPEKGGA